MHLAKEIAGPGRAVRHVLMTKERKIPPRHPIKTPFTGHISGHTSQFRLTFNLLPLPPPIKDVGLT